MFHSYTNYGKLQTMYLLDNKIRYKSNKEEFLYTTKRQAFCKHLYVIIDIKIIKSSAIHNC